MKKPTFRSVHFILMITAITASTMLWAASPAPWHMGDALKEEKKRDPSSDFETEIENQNASPVILEEELDNAKKMKKAGVKPASDSSAEQADYEIVEP